MQRENDTDPSRSQDMAPGESDRSPDVQGASSNALSCVVVGIGASAGGQSALRTFFSKIPPHSGLTFVVILHIPKDGPSFLADMLSRFTSMPVVTAENGMTPLPNRVHVIPAGRELVIRRGLFRLEPPSGNGATFHPIDRFFLSLAQEAREKAVAVILSGFGSDGAEGVKAVKEAGGLVMVQNPDLAEAQNMPRSALETGQTDLCLDVEGIAGKILDFVQGKGALKGDIGSSEALEANLEAIFSIVKTRTGHDFSSYKRNTLLRRIERRMTVNHVDTLAKYIILLETSDHEALSLEQEILIGVTRFFRDPHAFEVLRNQVFPRLFADRNPEDPVRIWIACCSTGEEVYSVAILIREYMETHGLSTGVQVFATDIDPEAITLARAGIYTTDIEADLSENRLQKYFSRVEGGWQITKNLREMVIFAHHSLIKDPPFSRLDLMVCRNFLIYLNQEMQKRLMNLFHMVLKPRGILFLGASETIGNIPNMFTPLDKKWKIFERLDGPRPDDMAFPFTAPFKGFPRQGLFSRQRPAETPTPGVVVEKRLAEKYAPPCVVVNAQYEIVHVSGGPSRLLQVPSGEPTRDLLKMAREELRPALRAAVYKAFHEQKPIGFRGVALEAGDDKLVVNVMAEPFNVSASSEKLVMVVLETERAQVSLVAQQGVDDAPDIDDASKDMLVRQMEEQLRVTNEQLLAVTEQLETSQEGFMSANEELMSINEEYQSANEELHSTNEELETSKEELQALNEELVTVNAELHEKVEALDRANSNLQNLLTSSEIATLFLSPDLNIRLFSPAMADIFNLIQADIGRPFRHLNGTIDWTGLPEDARLALSTWAPVEREVATLDGERYFLMRTLPYRTSEGKVDGIVVTLFDISERRRAEDQNKSTALFPQENPFPVLRMNREGTLLFANRAASDLLNHWQCAVETTVPDFLRQELIKSFSEGKNREIELPCGSELFSFVLVPIIERGYANFYGYNITQRKEAEKALTESEHKFATLFNEASLPTVLARYEDFSFVDANDAWGKLFGFHREEMIGKTTVELGILRDEDQRARIIHEIKEKGQLRNLEQVLYTKAGTPLTVLSSVNVIEIGGKAYALTSVQNITDRKRAEEALRDSEIRYRDLVQNASSAIMRWRQDGTILFFNEYAETLFGWRADEILGTHVGILVPDQDSTGADLFSLVEKIASHPEQYANVVNENLRRDGSRLWMSWTNRAIHNPFTGGIEILAVGMDITQRKLAEDALRQSEEQFRIMFQHSSAGMVQADPATGRFLRVNESLCQFLGYSREELLQRTFFDVTCPEDRDVDRANLTNLFQGNISSFHSEKRYLRADGHIVWGEVTVNLVRDPNGKPIHTMAVVLDVTDRKRAAQRQELLAKVTASLLASEEPQSVVESLCNKAMEVLDCQVFFNFLVDEDEEKLHLNACGGIPDEQKRLIEWIDYGVAVCGCAARDACRIVIEDLPNIGDPRAEMLMDSGVQAFACHPLMVQGRVLGTLSFGTTTRPRFSNEDLSLMRVVADHVAIAMARQRTQTELLKAKEGAELATRAKGQFLANMSHELRTPMTSILGMLDFALQGDVPAEQREHLQSVRKSAHSLLRILNDILDFSRIEAGVIAFVEHPFRVKDLAKGVLDLFDLEAQRKGIGLSLDVSAQTPEVLDGDEGRIRQVLVNLVGNAMKFTDRGGVSLRIDAGNPHDDRLEVRFEVRDTGMGIPESDQHILFTPFSQVDNSNSRRFGGAGLGLAISREMVMRMGGRISYSSDPGEGSVFRVVLPLKEAAEMPEEPASKSTDPSLGFKAAGKPSPRLLVAEDDFSLQKLMELVLRRAGIDFDMANNGKMAVEMWAKGTYDMILMDVQMPQMDGFEAARAIRAQEEGTHIPIVALTAHAYARDEQRCLDADMDAYLAKPVDFKKLFAMIREMTGDKGASGIG